MPAPLNNTNAHAWPVEHIDALKACLAARMTFEETASVLNKHFGTAYTRSAVAGRTARLKLKSRNPPKRRDAPLSRAQQLRRKAAAARLRRGHAEKVIAMPPATPRFRPDPLPPLRCAEVEPLNVTLLELEPHQCRWPVSGEREHTLFCGRRKADGIVAPDGTPREVSYCIAHHRLSVGRGGWERGADASAHARKYGQPAVMALRLRQESY